MRSRANLRVVKGTPPTDLPDPEVDLPSLFAREQALLHELADVRAAQGRARERYRLKHGLLMLPSFDTLRRLFP